MRWKAALQERRFAWFSSNAYLDAGAEIVISASYQASRAGFHQLGISADDADTLITSSVSLARQACEEFQRDNAETAESRLVAAGTIKNRMAAVRWWARKVNRQNVVARSNDFYGIPNRIFATGSSKAKSVSTTQLEKVRDVHVRMSLELQQAFGLRREESIKFMPSYADQGDHIVLKPSWTKGGKTRTLPIRTPEQREVLHRAHRLAGKGSLIPSSRDYRQQVRIYDGHSLRAGLSKMHGLRHAYAQQRYEELTGWQSPIAGGPSSKCLSPEQRGEDHQARLVISREMGHEREQVTAIYLGR